MGGVGHIPTTYIQLAGAGSIFVLIYYETEDGRSLDPLMTCFDKKSSFMTPLLRLHPADPAVSDQKLMFSTSSMIIRQIILFLINIL